MWAKGATSGHSFLDRDTVCLTSIDHPQIEGAYILGLCAVNFIFLFASGPLVSEGPDATIGFAFSTSDG